MFEDTKGLIRSCQVKKEKDNILLLEDKVILLSQDN
jgi:hypothetical protein